MQFHSLSAPIRASRAPIHACVAAYRAEVWQYGLPQSYFSTLAMPPVPELTTSMVQWSTGVRASVAGSELHVHEAALVEPEYAVVTGAYILVLGNNKKRRENRGERDSCQRTTRKEHEKAGEERARSGTAAGCHWGARQPQAGYICSPRARTRGQPAPPGIALRIVFSRAVVKGEHNVAPAPAPRQARRRATTQQGAVLVPGHGQLLLLHTTERKRPAC